MEIAKSEKDLELKKHVNAIHCTNNLTLVQRKLFNALLFHAYPDLQNKSKFEIPTRTLCNLIGYNSNDYGKLKKALLALITIAIEWNVVDYTSSEPTSNWNASSALASAKLARGTCTYEYSSLMRELLYHPEIYGRINMAILSKFKSSYGIALYENCIRYQNLPQTPWFSFEVFRKLMGVLDGKYQGFNDFKKRVLNTAIVEVNEYSAIIISPEIKRKNQKVESIRFKITAKTFDNNNNELKSSGTNYEIINILTNDFNLSPQAISEIFEKYEADYILEKVKLIKSSVNFRLGKIRGLAGYLIDALKKDYKASRKSKELNVIKAQKTEVQVKSEAKEQELLRLYNQYIKSVIDNYFSSLHIAEQQILIEQFRTKLQNENSLFYGWFKKDGLAHPGIRSLFHAFLQNQEIHLFENNMTFEEFKDRRAG